MVTTNSSQTFRQAIAHNHIYTDRMDKFFHFRIHCGTSCGEEMGILQTQFLTNQREYRLVEHLVFQMQCQRWTLPFRQIVDIMLLSYMEGMVKQLTFGCIRFLNFLFYTHKHLFPEARHTRHTGRMGLFHRLLHFQRIGVHNQSGTLCKTQYLPTLLKDMSKWQEVQYTVVFTNRHTFIIGLHRSMILTASQNHTFRITRRTTCIKNIGDIIHGGCSLNGLHLRLSWEIIT